MEKLFTTQMLLNEIIDLGTKSHKEIEQQQDNIIPLLKAFDLHVDEIEDKFFQIFEFKTGLFIRHRKCDKQEVSMLLQEFIEMGCIKNSSKLIEEGQTRYGKDAEYNLLASIFHGLFAYREALEITIKFRNSCLASNAGIWISTTIIQKHFLRDIRSQAKEIDNLLLKIIGEKDPVTITYNEIDSEADRDVVDMNTKPKTAEEFIDNYFKIYES